ncbi:MAG: foldase protein PrsA [Acidobacteriota bacterium]|nr:foldase protein PrsA [Acidobacteriota bacterium]
MSKRVHTSHVKRARGLALLVCVLLAAACTGRAQQTASGASEPSGTVVATVEGRAIPARVFEMYLKNGREGLGLDERTEEGRRRLGLLREGVVSELIDRELIRLETERRNLRPDAARVDVEESRAVEQLGGEEKFKEYLAARRLTREEFMETVRAPLYGELLRGELGKDLKVTDAEVKAFYEAHKRDAEFQLPERVAVSHILVAARPALVERQLREEKGLDGEALQKAVSDEMARRRARAEELRRRLGSHPCEADFAALARTDSDDAGTRERGGSLGLLQRGSHPKEFDDAAFALKSGELSAVVQTEFGFHVIKATAHEPARPLTYEEAAPEIQRRLSAGREAETLKAWLISARRVAHIRVAEGFRFGALRKEFPVL